MTGTNTTTLPPQKRYSTLPAGAILFVHEATWIAKAIQFYEAFADRTGLSLDIIPNHVAMVGLDGRAISPDPIGVIRRRVDKWFKPGNAVFMAELKGISPEDKIALAAAAESQVGKMYDYGGFLRFPVMWWVRLTGCLLPSWFPRPDPDKPFCSEMAAMIYAKADKYEFLCAKGPLGCSDCTPADMMAECWHFGGNWNNSRIWPLPGGPL